MEISEKMQVSIDFVKYCFDFLNIKSSPNIVFTVDRKWAIQFRSFGQYNPKEKNLTVYIDNRNLADILRTLAHELVHHKQNEDGRLDIESGETGSEIENEANALAGIIMRNYGKTHDMIYESILVQEEMTDYQIYCDMDGVLCDFDKQFDKYFGSSPKEYIEEHGQKVFDNAVDKAGSEFWATMDWTSGGESLWKSIAPYGVIILSSPGDYTGAKEGKTEWIQTHLNPAPKKIIFDRQSGEKHQELKGKSQRQIKNSVLIDDYSKNLNPWENMGGKAIKYDHTDYRDALSKIQDL